MTSVLPNREFPTGYADTLLQCEIKYKLSNQPTSDIVHQLMQLYRKGLQYCESIKSYKYLYFQLKINEILTTDSNLILKAQKEIQKNQLNESRVREQEKKQKKKATEKPLQKNQEEKECIKMLHTKQIISNTRESATRVTVRKMISENKIKHFEKQQKVKKQLATQNQTLAKKIEQRSRKSSSKFFSTKSQSTVDVSDLPQNQEPKKFGRNSVDLGIILEPEEQDKIIESNAD